MNEYFLIEQRNMEEELACVDETAPIWKYYHQEEDAIIDICMENFITCFLQGKSLVIETPVSTWCKSQYKNVGLGQYKNVGFPTSLYCLF